MIVDAHIHIPASDGDTMGWPTATTVDEVLRKMDEAGIDKGVITSARSTRGKDMKETRAGNREMVEAVERYPDRFIGACQVHPGRIGEAIDELRLMREEHGIVWLGELCGYLGGYEYGTRKFGKILDAACDLGMVVHMHTTDLKVLAGQAEAHPETAFVLAHMGGASQYRDRVAVVAEHPNVYIDISGSDISRAGILEAYVREAGEDKILFATDYVICEPVVYVARVNALDITREAREKLFHGNVERLLREAVSRNALS